MLAHETGLDVVAVGALVDRPLTSMIWLAKSGIKGIADLRGKTIATAGIPYQDAYLKTILARANLSTDDVKTVNVGFGLLPAILGGKADAMLGGFSNVEGVDLRLRGKDPVVTPVDRLGVPTYDELVLVANRRRLEEDPEPYRLFLAALARGTAAAVKSPGATVDALLEANPDLDPKLTRAEVDATLPLLSESGEMNAPQWADFIAWMRENALIASEPAPSQVLSDDYLPGKIPE
jgi:putative hydroxymethylpyrimidine transport system substrate-binding protein